MFLKKILLNRVFCNTKTTIMKPFYKIGDKAYWKIVVSVGRLARDISEYVLVNYLKRFFKKKSLVNLRNEIRHNYFKTSLLMSDKLYLKMIGEIVNPVKILVKPIYVSIEDEISNSNYWNNRT